MTLERINEVLQTTYDSPSFIEKPYRFWFRGYMRSMYQPELIGCAFAWPDKPDLNPRFFCCPTNGVPQEYFAGQAFDITAYSAAHLTEIDLIANEGLFEIRKLQALRALQDFVIKL